MSAIYKNGKYYGTGGGDEMPSEDMSEVVTPLPGVMSRRFKYSTEEQVVGEWIDGKPVYQKTMVFTNVPYGSGKTLEHGISNLDTVVDFHGVFINATSGYQYPTYVYLDATYAACVVGINDTVINYRLGSTWAANTLKCTIQYTKTTDEWEVI